MAPSNWLSLMSAHHRASSLRRAASTLYLQSLAQELSCSSSASQMPSPHQSPPGAGVSEQSRGQSLGFCFSASSHSPSPQGIFSSPGASSPSPGVGGAISGGASAPSPSGGAPSGGPPSTVAGASVGGLPSGGTSPGVPAASCAPGAEPSGTGGAPAGAPAGALAAGLAPPAGGAPPGALGDSGSGQPTNIISGRTVIRIRRVTATSSIERFTTAVSRSWQSATAFINVAPTKLTV